MLGRPLSQQASIEDLTEDEIKLGELQGSTHLENSLRQAAAEAMTVGCTVMGQPRFWELITSRATAQRASFISQAWTSRTPFKRAHINESLKALRGLGDA